MTPDGPPHPSEKCGCWRCAKEVAKSVSEQRKRTRDLQVHEESYYRFPCFDPEHEKLEERITRLEAVVEAADAREEAIRLALRCRERNAPFEPHCHIGAEHRRLLEDNTYRQARAELEKVKV